MFKAEFKNWVICGWKLIGAIAMGAIAAQQHRTQPLPVK
jgi:hypothetical protein